MCYLIILGFASGSGMILECMDSWSLHSSLLFVLRALNVCHTNACLSSAHFFFQNQLFWKYMYYYMNTCMCCNTLSHSGLANVNTRKRMFYTTFTNFSMEYHLMCKVYTDVGGIEYLYHVCPTVRKIIHSLKLVDYLHEQTDNPWYNYYLSSYCKWFYVSFFWCQRITCHLWMWRQWHVLLFAYLHTDMHVHVFV